MRLVVLQSIKNGDISNQIAHATTAGMYNYTGIGPATRASL